MGFRLSDSPTGRFSKRIEWLAAYALLFCLDASVALARAGGGGGYSSGGGSSSSYSSSSSSSSSSYGGGGSADFGFFDVLVLLGMLLIPIAHAYVARITRAERAAESRAAASLIQQRDPEFDHDAFLERVGKAFLKIQEAWSNQDLSSVRGFMSDGVFERFSIQIDEQLAQGYRNEMSRVRIRQSRVVEVCALPHFDVISVQIRASAGDARVSIATGELFSGSSRIYSAFTEVWTLLRGRAAHAKEGAGLIEGQCPNCSAPVDPARAWACGSCGAGLEGVPPDWVLVEITQLSEWRRTAQSGDAWWKVAEERDPGLTTAQLEDRGSVLFWRLMDANRRASVEGLQSVAKPAFLESMTARMSVARDRYVGDCSVGSVEVRGYIPGEEWDLALLEVRWAGTEFDRTTRAESQSHLGRKLSRSLLVMSRRAGVESDIGRCIVSAHCTQCGAPDEGQADALCGFCGAVLNDGHDWLLDRFVSFDHADARALLREASWTGNESWAGVADPAGAAPTDPLKKPGLHAERPASSPGLPGGEELYGWCLRLAYSDDHLDQRERKRLAKLADRLGISKESARKLRKAAQFGRLEVTLPESRADANAWLDELKAFASVDGKIAPNERRVVADLESRLDASLEG